MVSLGLSLIVIFVTGISSGLIENHLNGLPFGNPENPGNSLIAGDRAHRYQFPYQISLQIDISNNNFKHICSGAILSSDWIMTTAYCVSPIGNFRIVAGLLVQNQTDPDVQIIQVENVIVHPDYKRGISENDIALLRLKSPLRFTRAVHRIYLVPEDLENGDIWGPAILSEWNVQTQLRKEFSFNGLYYLIMYIMRQSDCANALALGRSKFSTNKLICTEKSSDALFCPGESGSPLVYSGYLVGITSWGLAPCGITLFTKVSYFIDFIKMYLDGT